MRIDQDVDCAALAERLQAVLPMGLTVHGIESVDPSAPALATLVTAGEYEIALAESIQTAQLKERVKALLAETSLPRERRGKRYDLRPLIEALEVVDALGGPAPGLRMRLKAIQGATGRPDEVLEALNLERIHAHIERTALICA